MVRSKSPAVFQTSLTIGGWVGMWHPMEVYRLWRVAVAAHGQRKSPHK